MDGKTALQEGQLIDVHAVGDADEVGKERFKNARDVCLLKSSEKDAVLDVVGGFGGEEEALDESEVEEEAVVRLVAQPIQKTIQHLPPLRPRSLKYHS